MAKFCIYLNELIIHNCSQDNSGLISLIVSQKNLKIVSIYPDSKAGTCKELGKVLGRKGNTTNDFNLYLINIIPLISLVNLKILLIYNFELYDIDSIEIKRFQLATLIKNMEENPLEIPIITKYVSTKNLEIFIKLIVQKNCRKLICVEFDSICYENDIIGDEILNYLINYSPNL
ncbi:hypothetical protein C1646_766885 [Rhizophagus diaphanus]|nr:hypothetical protein C1646_766885 [Rhizophagus diaphanus] [Rhizophagus sp. MUCL 43196]